MARLCDPAPGGARRYDSHMPRKPNYNFEKRQKELDRQKKKERKREERDQRKRENQADGGVEPTSPPDDPT